MLILIQIKADAHIGAAVLTFTKLQKYMGDRKISKKDHSDLMKEIIKAALRYVPIRNEIVAQVCKQVNNNPKE